MAQLPFTPIAVFSSHLRCARSRLVYPNLVLACRKKSRSMLDRFDSAPSFDLASHRRPHKKGYFFGFCFLLAGVQSNQSSCEIENQLRSGE